MAELHRELQCVGTVRFEEAASVVLSRRSAGTNVPGRRRSLCDRDPANKIDDGRKMDTSAADVVVTRSIWMQRVLVAADNTRAPTAACQPAASTMQAKISSLRR